MQIGLTKKEGDGTIVLVIQVDSNSQVVLSPEPGGERVTQDKELNLVAVNLSGAEQQVVVDFETGIDAVNSTKTYRLPRVADGAVSSPVTFKVKRLIPEGLKAVTVKYTVTIGTFVLDPDLRIER
jgi:hypothetical protein